MLRQEKAMLISVLKRLYVNCNYFRINEKTGKITCKKHWYSIKKHTTFLKEVIAGIIPASISRYSGVDSANYELLINAMYTNNMSQLEILTEVSKTFFNFIRTYKFVGEEVKLILPFKVKSFELPKLSKVKASIEALKNTFKSFVLHKKTKAKEKIVSNIVSIEEKVNETLTYVTRTVGQVCTGDAVLDEKYRTIIRYLSPQANVYCI